MVNYQLGKIYKIVCNITGLIYIGSTCEPTLARRLSKHKSNYSDYLKNKGHFITSFKILENNNFEIILIENVVCENKDELHKRERYNIENNECVNITIPGRTNEEYYNDNKQVLNIKCQIYKEKNKDNLKEKCKSYREKNRDITIAKMKENNLKRKEKLLIVQEII